MKKILKMEKGITMVALVVTIVVLLILASITLATLSGDNGIIDKAKQSKEETEIAQWEEKIDAAIIDAEKKHQNPTLDDIIDELLKDGIIENESKVDRNTGAITTKEPIHTIEGKLDDYLDNKKPEEPDNPVLAEYTVTYNYSENEGTSADVQSMAVKEGESIDLTKKATKNGYDFVGWNTNANAHEGLTTLKMGSSNVTLYAIYKKDITATFNYWNGSVTASSKVDATLYNKETSVQIKAPSLSNTIKDGATYTARGWGEKDEGNANIVIASNGRTTITGNKTYYGLYAGNATATFYYYSGGSQVSTPGNASTTMNSKGEIAEGTMTIPDLVIASSGPNGTRYAGVATKPNSTAIANVSSSNTTYYAFYSTPVTFYYEAGSSKQGTRIATSNGSSYSSSVNNQPTPSDYNSATFNYWSGISGQDSQVDPNATSYTEYYAVYKREITAYFSYYNGSGTSTTTSSAKRTYISTKGAVASLQTNISIPNKVKDSSGPEGTTYAYVANDVNGTSGSVTPSSEGGTYFAIYTKNVTITKKIYNNNNNYQYGTAYGYSNGTTLGATIKLDSATDANGYSFYGWCTTSSVNATPISNTTIYNVMDNTTYYALYRKSVTVAYNANGGSVYQSSQNAITYMNYQANTSGGTVTLPTPNWSGYTFLGWYTSSASGTRIGDAGSTYTPYSNITLYAQWEAEKSYINITIPSELKANYGETLTVTVSMNQKYDFELYKAETATGEGERIWGVDYTANTSSGGYTIRFEFKNLSYDDEGYYYLVVQTPEGEKESSSRLHLVVN